MERDEDQRNVEPPRPLEPPRKIVDAPQLEDDVDAGDSVVAPEPSVPLDQSAGADVPASSLASSDSDLSEGESDSEPQPDAPQVEATSNADPATRSVGNVMRIELPADIAIPPTRPSEAPRDRRSHLLPLDPGGALDDEADPVDAIFPPELRLPSDSGDPGARPRMSDSLQPEDGRPVDRGQTMPRVQVIVSLAGARAMGEEVVEEALAQAAPEFEQIAQSEIKAYDFEQESLRRTKDYRLRGPG